MELFIITITVCVALLSIHLYGFLPYPTLLIIIYIYAGLFLFLFNLHVVEYQMLDVFNFGGTEKYSSNVLLIYLAISILAVISFIGFVPENRGILNASISQRANDARKLLVNISLYLTVAIVGHFSLFCVLVDWSAIWSNSIYLGPLGDSDLSGGLSAFIFGVLPVMLLLCSCAVFVAWWQGLVGVGLISGTICIFYYLMMLGLHSRSSALVPVTLGLFAYIVKIRGFRITMLISALLCFVSIIIALGGRAGAVQGFAALPGDFIKLFSSTDGIEAMSADIAQGAFVLAETLVLSPQFPLRYEILSFSPFPSLIDGFSAILDQDQVRLHTFVPMGGIGEIYHFGPQFVMLGASIVLAACRLTIKTYKVNKISFVICNLLIICGLYGGFAYPVRTAMRFIWLSILIGALTIYFTKPKQRDKVRALIKRLGYRGRFRRHRSSLQGVSRGRSVTRGV